MYIYADNAATTRMSETVAQAMIPYLTDNFGNPSSLHGIGQRAKAALDDARERIAKCIGCRPDEIYFTSGGSEADNQAILSAAYAGRESGKTHIISSAFEHHAVLHTLEVLKEEGFEITLLDVHESGVIDPAQVADAIRDDTALVTIMYANNEIGTIQPIQQIGEICRERGVTFHTDAVQAISYLPVDVVTQNIDMLSLSAHKFHGPKGVGLLYVRNGVSVDSLIRGGAQEQGRRAGTENIPGIVGMAVALEEAVAHRDENNLILKNLQNRLIKGLSEIPYSQLNGDRNNRVPSNISFCFEGIDGESLLLVLDSKEIAVSSGSACNSGSTDASHVLLAIGRNDDIAHSGLRISLGTDITTEQVDYIIKSVRESVEYLRSFSPFWNDLLTGKRQHILI